jgi:hypothetical protein
VTKTTQVSSCFDILSLHMSKLLAQISLYDSLILSLCHSRESAQPRSTPGDVMSGQATCEDGLPRDWVRHQHRFAEYLGIYRPPEHPPRRRRRGLVGCGEVGSHQSWWVLLYAYQEVGRIAYLALLVTCSRTDAIILQSPRLPPGLRQPRLSNL